MGDTIKQLLAQLLRENIDVLREVMAEMTTDKAAVKAAYSVNEVAKLTGLSVATIHRRVTSGAIPVVPGLAPIRIPANFLERMCNE